MQDGRLVLSSRGLGFHTSILVVSLETGVVSLVENRSGKVLDVAGSTILSLHRCVHGDELRLGVLVEQEEVTTEVTTVVDTTTHSHPHDHTTSYHVHTTTGREGAGGTTTHGEVHTTTQKSTSSTTDKNSGSLVTDPCQALIDSLLAGLEPNNTLHPTVQPHHHTTTDVPTETEEAHTDTTTQALSTTVGHTVVDTTTQGPQTTTEQDRLEVGQLLLLLLTPSSPPDAGLPAPCPPYSEDGDLCPPPPPGCGGSGGGGDLPPH